MSQQELNSYAAAQNKKEKKPKKGKRKVQFLGTNIFIDGGFDIIFMILVFALLTVGLVMMFSASYVSAKYGGAETGGDPMHYIKRQLVFAVAGIALMFFISKINPEIFKKLVPLIGGICLVLLVAVLIHPYSIPGKPDIKRWLWLPVVGVFQPSDIAKLGLIMVIAWASEKYKKQLETTWLYPLIFFGGLAMVCVLIFLESHLSCTLLVFILGITMLFLGGIDKRWFIYGIICGAVLLVVFWQVKEKILAPHQLERITSFLNKDYDDTDARWQTNQSLFALGSGGFFGLGLGNSRQKYLYMPEPQNDFIFAIVGEELGFFRCVLIILLFAALVCRGFVISAKAKSMYERLLVQGISLHVGFQTIMNILVVTDSMPNTGIALPFFSYGGTALVMLLIEMGLVLGVSRTGERKPRKAKVKKDAEQ